MNISKAFESISLLRLPASLFLNEDKIVARLGLNSPGDRSFSEAPRKEHFTDKLKEEYRQFRDCLTNTLQSKTKEYGAESLQVAMTHVYIARLAFHYARKFDVYPSDRDKMLEGVKPNVDQAAKIFKNLPIGPVHHQILADFFPPQPTAPLQDHDNVSDKHLAPLLLTLELADAYSCSAWPYMAIEIRAKALNDFSKLVPALHTCKAANHLRQARDLLHNLCNITSGTFFSLSSCDESLLQGIRLITSNSCEAASRRNKASEDNALDIIARFNKTYTEDMRRIRQSLEEFEQFRTEQPDTLKGMSGVYHLLRAQELLFQQKFQDALSEASRATDFDEGRAVLSKSLDNLDSVALRIGSTFPNFEYWCLSLAAELARAGFGEQSYQYGRALFELGNQRRNHSGLTGVMLSHIFPEQIHNIIDVDLVREASSLFTEAATIFSNLLASGADRDVQFRLECCQRELRDLSKFSLEPTVPTPHN
jgi:hypothetical protein